MNNDTMTGRAAKYQDQAAAQLATGEETALPEPIPAINVRNETPALGTARAVTLSANNPYVLALPQDPMRRNATLLAVDNDVYVTSSREIAMEVNGSATATDAFYLPKAIPLPITSKAAFWVACTTTATSSRVSVLVTKDDGS